MKDGLAFCGVDVVLCKEAEEEEECSIPRPNAIRLSDRRVSASSMTAKALSVLAAIRVSASPICISTCFPSLLAASFRGKTYTKTMAERLISCADNRLGYAQMVWTLNLFPRMRSEQDAYDYSLLL